MTGVSIVARAAGLALLGAVAAAGPAAAQQSRPAAAQPVRAEPAPPLVRAIAGNWDFIDQKTKLTCRANFTVNPAAKGYAVVATPNCRRRAMVLMTVQSWTLEEDQHVALHDKDGNLVANFRPDGTRHNWRATFNEVPYELKAAGAGAGTGSDRSDAVARILIESRLTDLPPLNPASLAGLYSIARERNKPICSIDLATVPAARRGQYVAKLSGGCIDQGLKVFDPITWYTDRGRLYLVARKGHEQRLAPDKDGVFTKDPPVGTPLFLRKQ